MSLNGKNFILKFKDSKLERSKLVGDSELAGVAPVNADPEGCIYVLCDNCNKYMEYDASKSTWICPECGAKTKASSVYSEFDRECEDFVRTHPNFAD